MIDPRSDTISKNQLAPGQDFIERMILRSMNEGVITLECNGSIHLINPAAERILGYGESELKGNNFETALSQDPENQEFKEIIRQAIQNNYQTERKDVRFRRTDGQTIDLSVTSSSLQIDECLPAIENVVVVFRDITAFKSLERMKRRAINHLSHELRTPLAIIQASLERLNKANLDPQKHLQVLERIQRNLERLTDIQDIVEEILDPPPFEPKRFPVAPYIEEVLDKIRNQAVHRSVALISSLDPVDTDLIDPQILEMILNTLVKNAIENTPDGKEVIVSLSTVDSGVLLQVQDKGVGVTIQDQEFIFEGFHNTQPTDEYSSKRPFDFNAGGKGLELLRLKVLSESGYFDIWFETGRCKHIPTDSDHCPGSVSECSYVTGPEQCQEPGGTTFSILFH
ncbi:MAG TPA: PAS domain S-box protein [Desulfomonilaceae bacterium]|nr:PAS domain S-box protein [Desulfomonilaceae bacterium]